ncbi:MAG: cytochrome C [Planctomycetes bacterium]|nr:cytochrome C [Planctomycetota bacterium]
MALNDERLEKGLPPKEAEAGEVQKTFVWPDLVYIEFICLILFTVFLTVWSIALKAPLEQPANPAKTPNPSKAPWYFLGLQEMLVYFDPWIAGVLLPTMIITGLMMLPYIDKNPKGNGYYTFKERKFAISIFMYGFVVAWVLLIFMGTFLRGPNWNFFGPYEPWDIHKLEPLTNVNLSEIIYLQVLGVGMPRNWFIREIWGILLVLGYFVAMPGLLARFVPMFREFYKQLGMIRYSVFIVHLLVMGGMLIKMLLRWTINLKYLVGIPEYFFNI